MFCYWLALNSTLLLSHNIVQKVELFSTNLILENLNTELALKD